MTKKSLQMYIRLQLEKQTQSLTNVQNSGGFEMHEYDGYYPLFMHNRGDMIYRQLDIDNEGRKLELLTFTSDLLVCSYSNSERKGLKKSWIID